MQKYVFGISTIDCTASKKLDNNTRRPVEGLVEKRETSQRVSLPLCLSAKLPEGKACVYRKEIQGIFFCRGIPDKCQVFTNPERR